MFSKYVNMGIKKSVLPSLIQRSKRFVKKTDLLKPISIYFEKKEKNTLISVFLSQKAISDGQF